MLHHKTKLPVMTIIYLSDIDIPSLTCGTRRSTHLLARLVLLKERPAVLAHLQLAASFLRTLDFACSTYRMAKIGLTTFSKQRATNGFFDGVSALETCLSETHRAIQFASALSRAGIKMPDGSPLVPRMIRTRVLSSRIASRIGSLRHAIQHLDERIIKGEIGLAHALGPRPDSSSFSIGRMTVKYGELAGWLTELDALALRVQFITQCTVTAKPSGR